MASYFPDIVVKLCNTNCIMLKNLEVIVCIIIYHHNEFLRYDNFVFKLPMVSYNLNSIYIYSLYSIA